MEGSETEANKREQQDALLDREQVTISGAEIREFMGYAFREPEFAGISQEKKNDAIRSVQMTAVARNACRNTPAPIMNRDGHVVGR
jgi:hypothetical protein